MQNNNKGTLTDTLCDVSIAICGDFLRAACVFVTICGLAAAVHTAAVFFTTIIPKL